MRRLTVFSETTRRRAIVRISRIGAEQVSSTEPLALRFTDDTLLPATNCRLNLAVMILFGWRCARILPPAEFRGQLVEPTIGLTTAGHRPQGHREIKLCGLSLHPRQADPQQGFALMPFPRFSAQNRWRGSATRRPRWISGAVAAKPNGPHLFTDVECVIWSEQRCVKSSFHTIYLYNFLRRFPWPARWMSDVCANSRPPVDVKLLPASPSILPLLWKQTLTKIRYGPAS